MANTELSEIGRHGFSVFNASKWMARNTDPVITRDATWPPRVERLERTYLGFFEDYEDLVREGYWENGIKAIEENGYS